MIICGRRDIEISFQHCLTNAILLTVLMLQLGFFKTFFLSKLISLKSKYTLSKKGEIYPERFMSV